MTRLVATRMFQARAIAGTDRVLAGMFVPAKSVIRAFNASIDLHGITPASQTAISTAAIAIWWMPIADPDSSGTMTAIWDVQVPKDTSANTMDLDVAASDTTPFYEPGGVTWEDIFDIGAQPRKLFAQEIMSHIGRNIALNRDPETPFNYEYWPGAHVDARMKRPIRVLGPGLIAVGLASPDTTLTSATEAQQAIGEADWGQLQFIDHVMERAMMSLLGLTEAGAETPWDEATALLRQVLAPKVLEVDAGLFSPITWSGVGTAKIVVDVQGSIPKGSINPGQV